MTKSVALLLIALLFESRAIVHSADVPNVLDGTTAAPGAFTPLTVGLVGSQAVLQGDAANALAQRNGSNSQTLRVYGTTTGPKYVALNHNGTDSTLTNTGGGHIFIANGTPTIGACGTSPSLAGNDTAIFLTVGTGGAATTCAANFSGNWTTAPVCVAQNDADRVSYSIATSVSAVTITATAAFTASSHFHILCMGR